MGILITSTCVIVIVVMTVIIVLMSIGIIKTDKSENNEKIIPDIPQRLMMIPVEELEQQIMNEQEELANNPYDNRQFGYTHANIRKQYIDDVNSSGLFHNVRYINAPLIASLKCTWKLLLAVTENNQIIPNSNSFFLRDHGLGYEIRHNVVLSLIGAYYHLLRTSEIQPKIELEGSYIFMYNTFTCANSGHDLSHIMACIQYLKTIPESENILLVLMKSTTTTWRTYEFLRLFFTDERFVWLDNNTVYNIKNVHIPVMREFSIQDFPDVVEQAVDMCGINPYSQNSIFLVKNTSMQQVLEKGTAFHCPKLIQRLKAAGWIILNPEIMHMKDIIWYLSSATNIVTSTGAILYTHMMFFSKEAKVFYLQHSDTFAPYACPGITYNIIRVPSLQIDDDMPKLYQKLPVINTSLTHT